MFTATNHFILSEIFFFTSAEALMMRTGMLLCKLTNICCGSSSCHVPSCCLLASFTVVNKIPLSQDTAVFTTVCTCATPVSVHTHAHEQKRAKLYVVLAHERVYLSVVPLCTGLVLSNNCQAFPAVTAALSTPTMVY